MTKVPSVDYRKVISALRRDWQTTVGLHPSSSGSGFVTSAGPWWLRQAREILPRRPAWRFKINLGQSFFEGITRSAVPVDLQAIHLLRRSPLAMDLYIWVTYRMSYLKKPTLVPWEGLQSQFGADYARPRDFRRKVLIQLQEVLSVYPTVRVSQTDTGLRLYPSPPHVQAPR